MKLLELYEQNREKYLDTDKEYPNHHYISKVYNDKFKKFKNQTINFLEIGAGSGGSLLLWNDFFQNANIYALDIGSSFDKRFDVCKQNVKDLPRVKLIESDAYQESVCNSLPNFDIIIDDGPHTKESHLKFLDLYLPKLNSGGIIIIEDIDDEHWIEEYLTKVPDGYLKTTIDTDRSLEYNNLLFLIEKP
jgi:predicted O-methyltransferase YrrM